MCISSYTFSLDSKKNCYIIIKLLHRKLKNELKFSNMDSSKAYLN